LIIGIITKNKKMSFSICIFFLTNYNQYIVKEFAGDICQKL